MLGKSISISNPNYSQWLDATSSQSDNETTIQSLDIPDPQHTTTLQPNTGTDDVGDVGIDKNSAFHQMIYGRGQPVPQTDSKEPEFKAEGPSLQMSEPLKQPFPQTGLDDIEFHVDGINLQTEIKQPPQADPKTDGNNRTHSSDIRRSSRVARLPQADIESGQGVTKIANAAPILQTGSGDTPLQQNAAGRRIEQSRSGETLSHSGASSQTTSQSGIIPEQNSRPGRRRRRETPIISIDDERSVETYDDKHRNDLLDLAESQKGRKILTGIIKGVERSADNPNLSFAVTYHGDFKVIIPAEETVTTPQDLRGRSPGDVMHYMITKRLDAEIDYIVKGIDLNAGIVAASRLEAMALRRREYYFGTDRDGNNLLYEGVTCEARVVSVIRVGLFVDLFGVETYIPLRECSYQRWSDATAYYQPGQRVLVKIVSLDRSNRNNIKLSVSIKQAGENPYQQALKRYTPGSRYVGTVSMVDTNGVFVSLEGGVDCLCSYPKRGRPPRGCRVTVRVIGVNHEANRIWGAITHMATTIR